MPRRRVPAADKQRVSVFLNIPYDRSFEKLYLAYIAGVAAFGLIPRATLEIPGSERRLDRILTLVQSCGYSIHDLSRVQLNPSPPRTPRFNMPFELGLAVAMDKLVQPRAWYVFESVQHRVHKSLSDLDGTEIYIHHGTVKGVLSQLCDAFVERRRRPSVQQMYQVYLLLRRNLPRIVLRAGARTPYSARVFRELTLLTESGFRKLDGPG